MCRLISRDHRRYIQSRVKRQGNNRNNNQASLVPMDVAECIDDDMEFVSGHHILLSKGSLILNDDDAQMVIDRFQLNLKGK
jgi:hypothetical protein